MSAEIIAQSIDVTCKPGYTSGRERDYSRGASSCSYECQKGSYMGERVTAVITD